MEKLDRIEAGSPRHSAGMVGLSIVAILSIGPLILGKRPVQLTSLDNRLLGFESRPFILAMMWLVIVYRAWLDRRTGLLQALSINVCLGGAAIAVAGWHWYAIDSAFHAEPNGSLTPNEGGQKQLFEHILNREPKQGTFTLVPHVYRPLPYGFVRLLELLTGDWHFAHWSYHWFFTYWFFWASWSFCRRYHASSVASALVGWMILLYPFSLWYSGGQLIDPMSHALFVLALNYIVTDQWGLLLLSLVLGVAAKETAVVLVVGYWSCYWRRGLPTVVRTVGLLLGCVLAYVAVRLPVGWIRSLAEEKSIFQSINATSGLMIWRNLRVLLDWADYWPHGIENYLLPLLFVGPFVPGLIRNWRCTDRCLRALAVSVAPLVLTSSLCFSWLREARNYMPLIPLMGSAAIAPGMTAQLWISRLGRRLTSRRFLTGILAKPQSAPPGHIEAI
jgi:hypothetical protein